MKDEEIEVLFEDDEDIELTRKRKENEESKINDEEEFVKDPSLDNVFPDKDDVQIDRLLNEFEENSNDDALENDKVSLEEISSEENNKAKEKNKKMKL